MGALRYVGRLMSILGWVAVAAILGLLYVIPFVQVLSDSPTWSVIEPWFRQNFLTSPGLIQILILFVPLGLMIYSGSWVSQYSVERANRLEERIIGMLRSYGRISLVDLSAKLGLTVTQTENCLALIRGCRDVVFSISDGAVIMPGFERSRPVKEVERITREVMTVACKYCGGLIPMGSGSCPECGATLKAT